MLKDTAIVETVVLLVEDDAACCVIGTGCKNWLVSRRNVPGYSLRPSTRLAPLRFP
jgi:hypothetical protein